MIFNSALSIMLGNDAVSAVYLGDDAVFTSQFIDDCSAFFECGDIGGWTNVGGEEVTAVIETNGGETGLKMSKSSSNRGARWYTVYDAGWQPGHEYVLEYDYYNHYRGKGLAVKSSDVDDGYNGDVVLNAPGVTATSTQWRHYTSPTLTPTGPYIFIMFDNSGQTHVNHNIDNVVLTKI